MSNVIPMEYDGQPVDFSAEGWINATKVAKRFGRRPNDWLALGTTVEYMAALNRHFFSDTGKSGNENLVRTQRGGAHQGTWLHPKMAVAFARWLDVDFQVWCDAQIDALLRGNVAPLEQFNRACKALNGRKELASAQGRGLAAWRFEKPALEYSVAYWLRELQMTLPLEDQQGGDQ